MSVRGIPICFACAHYVLATESCKAFPEGIPAAILWDGFDHRQPFEGDQGVRFQLEPNEEDALGLYERTTGAPDDED